MANELNEPFIIGVVPTSRGELIITFTTFLCSILVHANIITQHPLAAGIETSSRPREREIWG